MGKEIFLELWYKALHSQYGIVVETDNPTLCIQKFYQARKEIDDPQLQTIGIKKSPTNVDQLWLIKRDVDA